jgi:hypothetical protein
MNRDEIGPPQFAPIDPQSPIFLTRDRQMRRLK